MSAGLAELDALAERTVARSPVRLGVARTAADRDAAFRLRCEAVLEQGWASPADYPDGRETDGNDADALLVLGRCDGVPACTARIVLPGPEPLPTERACGIVVAPAGEVADVGRIVVAPRWRRRDSGVLFALLAASYLEVRGAGLTVGCGMMTAAVRALAAALGLRLQVVGPQRRYWHAERAPVRFDAVAAGPALLAAR